MKEKQFSYLEIAKNLECFPTPITTRDLKKNFLAVQNKKQMRKDMPTPRNGTLNTRPGPEDLREMHRMTPTI